MKFCRIAECGATLNGMNYFVVILDDDSTVPICRCCMRKIHKARRDLEHR